MQPIHIITTAMMMAHGAAAAFNTTCAWWVLSGQVSLTGYCAAAQDTLVNGRHWALSTLDLNRCIGVDPTANAMVWQAGGNAFAPLALCSGCAMQSSQVVMQCGCVSAATGGRTSSSVNLDDHIYTDDYGRLAC